MTDAERNEKYVDERLCAVNDMTFKEWELYQDFMIRYYGGYLYNNGRTLERVLAVVII